MKPSDKPYDYLRALALLAFLVVMTGQAVKAQALVPMSGVLEYYYLTGTGDRSTAKPMARYLHITGQAAPKVSYVIGQIDKNGKNLLDENYLALGGQAQLRAGRFRSAFGHSDWSECYYTGFAHAPLMRSVALDGTLSLNRLDTGIDWQGGTGTVQTQFGLIDVGAKPMQVAASHPDHLIARIQTYAPNIILGLNALTPVGKREDRLNLFDLDWHWSKPHVQSSGEYLVGQGGGRHPHGYYADFYLHPQGLLRTTFLTRIEALTADGTVSSDGSAPEPSPGDPTEHGDAPGHGSAAFHDSPTASGNSGAALRAGYSQLYTIGVKQILSRQFTLEVNRSWGSGLATHGQRGLTLQLITFVRF